MPIQNPAAAPAVPNLSPREALFLDNLNKRSSMKLKDSLVDMAKLHGALHLMRILIDGKAYGSPLVTPLIGSSQSWLAKRNGATDLEAFTYNLGAGLAWEAQQALFTRQGFSAGRWLASSLGGYGLFELERWLKPKVERMDNKFLRTLLRPLAAPGYTMSGLIHDPAAQWRELRGASVIGYRADL